MHVIALIAALTVAQTTQPAPETVKFKKIQVVEFPDEVIDGTLEAPTGLILEGRKPPRFHSLVKVRDNFNDKLLESVHEM